MTAETLESRATEEQFKRLAVLRHVIEQSGDEMNAVKFTQLAEKVKNEEFVVGFCGHFSAGKSTMINRIAGKDLLPSNPIPTSANLAKIQSDDDAYARVFFNNKEAIEYDYPYDLDEIRKFAIDGKVRSVEIHHPLTDIPEDVTLLDTPGIDSTDDAHRVATESALHLADVIFYVTDYNHVLSEMNVTFLRQLQQQKKRITLIVNQIDKHSAGELEFSDYRQGIIDGFASQGIMPERIFFTSLREPNDAHNEFDELKGHLDALISEKDRLIEENAELSAHQLIQDHVNWYSDNQSDAREKITESLGELSDDDRRKLMERYRELQEQLQAQTEKPERFEETGRLEVNELLDAAILMPYETREAGRSYVESIQPDFKIGLFGAKKKTELEREARLENFHEKVVETAAATDWQIKELLVKQADAFGVNDEAYKQSVYDLKVTIDAKLLTDQLQQGATFNANYVLRYSDKVADAIKQLYRRAAFGKLAEAKALLEQDSAGEELKASVAEFAEKADALDALQALEDEANAEKERLVAVLDGAIDEAQLADALGAMPEEPVVTKAEASGRATAEPEKAKLKVEKEAPKKPVEAREDGDFHARLKETAERLRQTVRRVDGVKGLQTSVEEMKDRAERLENNRFTVALFGAFSAGKSSFANALIGEGALPVSPNPTTAAINKILPPDEEHPHKTAVIHYKQEDEMIADVRAALKPIGKTLNDLEVLPSLVDQSETIPFLQAVARGLSDVKDRLGTHQTVDQDTFYDIVSSETKAVFVESIELYYDCPLTRQGITLVDTPGADSINARHTNVAFDYIKNADAILFVTYYNHAFSRADREFLIQLGRVKDSFAMDKMFFIVNAADLAASEEELEAVVDYVGGNLQAYGIRNPRVYPVSSQTALAAKQGKVESAPAFDEFEREFKHFTLEELTNIAVKAAEENAARVIGTLDSFLFAAREDESVRRRKYQEALDTKKRVENLVRNVGEGTERTALAQEIDQLLYYVEQRVFLRYSDLFKETFNPSVLNGNGSKKEALQRSLRELIDAVGFDLAQEMRATGLRVEKFANSILQERVKKISADAKAEAKDYSFPPYENAAFDTPIFENGLGDLDLSRFNDVLGMFKNAKQFFEKDGKAKMSERLQERLQQPVSDYLEANGRRLKETYDEAFVQETEQIKERLLKQVAEYSDGILAALAMDIDADALEKIRDAVASIWT